MIEYNCWHQVQQQETVAELKVALEEAVLGHTLVHQELELLRSSSSDVEFVEHIKALEEQLSLKTAEVTKQRFASAQVTAYSTFNEYYSSIHHKQGSDDI